MILPTIACLLLARRKNMNCTRWFDGLEMIEFWLAILYTKQKNITASGEVVVSRFALLPVSYLVQRRRDVGA